MTVLFAYLEMSAIIPFLSIESSLVHYLSYSILPHPFILSKVPNLTNQEQFVSSVDSH